MSRIDLLIQEYQKLTPFYIRHKEDSLLMKFVNVIVVWFCPDFMTHYTTVIGNTIYLPSAQLEQRDEDTLMRILAHEIVHILDAERWTFPLFWLGYLFPQILALGVFLFPLLGFWALLFLLFLLPLPASFRLYFEARAYAIDVLTASKTQQSSVIIKSAALMASWNYYRMHPSEEAIQDYIMHWLEQAESGRDEILSKVLLVYEMVQEMYEE